MHSVLLVLLTVSIDYHAIRFFLLLDGFHTPCRCRFHIWSEFLVNQLSNNTYFVFMRGNMMLIFLMVWLIFILILYINDLMESLCCVQWQSFRPIQFVWEYNMFLYAQNFNLLLMFSPNDAKHRTAISILILGF